MRRVALPLRILLLVLAPTVVLAQMLPGFPSFSGVFGTPGGGLRAYVGGNSDFSSKATTVSFSTQAIDLADAAQFQHSYPTRGVWLGLALPVDLGPQFGLYASAWYFARTGTYNSLETYNGVVATREWNTDLRWRFLDGLAMLRVGPNFSFLGGLRYEYYIISFTNPQASGIVSLATDQADAHAENWIPLLGAQYENNWPTGSMVFRAMGFPAVGGNVKYLQPFVGTVAFQTSGNYGRGGYFLELFTEYARKFGPGELGLFAGWNIFHAQGTSVIDFVGTAFGAPNLGSYDFSLNRTSLTWGGSVSLAFDLPY